MKQDIRKLFKEDEENNLRELPKNHRDQFLKKLRGNPSKLKKGLIFKIAVSAFIVVGVGFGIYDSHNSGIQENSMVSQMKEIENQYLKSIEQEWNEFTSATNDSTLIKRFEFKLEDLNQDYNDLSNQFKSNPNHTIIIQSLIDNLQTRLKLLEDIQNHIKIINSKPKAYETVL